MNTAIPLDLLGGLTPQTFMRRHWQKKPLLIRAAFPGMQPLLARSALLQLAGQEAVQSRLVQQTQGGAAWKLRHGPFARRSLPSLQQPGWTLLVQGVDLHDARVHALLQQFRFVPDARLDDLMISYATPGGGVGPHFDSYDVFLLQVHGHRRWRIGRQKDLSLVPDVPLKILANFVPEQEFVLAPGDMLYLPPRYAHDGVAEDECMTYSIGFRAPAQGELAQELLQRLADQAVQNLDLQHYRDPGQAAVDQPASLPPGLLAFAQASLQATLDDPQALPCALGEILTEPKASVWFEPGQPWGGAGLALDRRSRMLYDTQHVFINGESFRASGRDARLMQQLADARMLSARDARQLSRPARALVAQWCEDGWLHEHVG